MFGQQDYSEMEIKLLGLLSHSSLETLDSCPRRYELTKLLNDMVKEESEDDVDKNFGSAYGAGVQALFLGKSLDEAILIASQFWRTDLLAEKKKKSFWTCCQGLDVAQRYVAQLLTAYEVVSINGVPATELSLRIDIGGGFYYRGYVDILLRNKKTRELVVLDVKTTAFNNADDAMYQNSGQVLSYSIIVDRVIKDHAELGTGSSFTVLYFVFLVGRVGGYSEPVEIKVFQKGRLHRAVWLKQLLLQVNRIETYIREGCFPMSGGACYSFFRQCPFFGTCTMSNKNMVNPARVKTWVNEEAARNYTYSYTLDELIEAQLESDSN